jgi:peroxiredoxin
MYTRWRDFARLTIVGLLFGGALGVALTLGRPSFSGSAADEAEDSGGALSLAIGSTAPDFELTTPDGEVFHLSEQKGKLVIINFWATWCAPCRLEMPVLQEQQDWVGEGDLIILAVNNDEPAHEIREFGTELGITFPLLMDPGGEIQKAYRVRAYPTTYFLDRRGIIRQVHLGMMTEGQVESYLLEEK